MPTSATAKRIVQGLAVCVRSPRSSGSAPLRSSVRAARHRRAVRAASAGQETHIVKQFDKVATSV